MRGVDSIQNLVKSLLLPVKRFSNKIINTVFKIVVLNNLAQKVFSVYLVDAFPSLLLRLHKTSSEVLNPFVCQINVSFLFDILESVFFNNWQDALHALLRLFLLLILN